MTEPRPSADRLRTRSAPDAWSRCTATGTAAARATARQARAMGVQRAVAGGAVLADLQHHRGAGRLGAGDDGLGVLDADDVEGADAAARARRGPMISPHGGQRHQRLLAGLRGVHRH